jgi:predicted GH43/DUF377 family glycosyl hydrolase
VADYVVESVCDVKLACHEPLKSMDWMSPFVWRDGGLHWMMMRGVPNPLEDGKPTGIIWCGCSHDGVTFDMDEKPAIVPGPEAMDAGGVEDPTVEVTDEGLMVYYTGVEAGRQQGSLLVATGKDLDSLKKRAVMLKAPEGQGNIKEATLAQAEDGSWRMFYEYAADGASRIGLATSPKLGGPWTPIECPVTVRPESWDNWHLSTGPIVSLPGRKPVMFYNGATHDARWRIGWVAFDPMFSKVVDRCIEPLVVPPPAEDRTATDIAFAASALVDDERSLTLYYSLEDRRLARARVRGYFD